MRRLVLLVLIAFCSLLLHAQSGVICDAICKPDPGSGSYGASVGARPLSPNARGNAPSAVVAGPKNSSGTVVLGSSSFNAVFPVLRLRGRAGMDLVLNLYYNSAVWSIDTFRHRVTFNLDRDFPGYGFRLDFGYVEYDSVNDQYILTEGDGTKRALPNSGTGYESTDGSVVHYNQSTNVLTYKDGRTVQYLPFPGQANQSFPKLYRPVWIKDRNGNYFSIAYVSGGADQQLAAVSDTLGRVITFNYDSNGRLTSLTQLVHPSGTRTYVTFSWDTRPLNYAFASPLTVINSPASGSTINVLTGINYPLGTSPGTGYKFTWGDWGIVKRIDIVSSTGATRTYRSFDYPLASSGGLSDVPTYTHEVVSPDGVNTSTWTFSVTKSGGVVTSEATTDPNGNTTTSNVRSDGFVSSVQVASPSGNIQNTAYSWTTAGVSTVLGSTTTTLNDSGQQSSMQYAYDSSANVTDLYQYDFDGTLKRHTVTAYAGGAYANLHILNLPTQILVKDGAGNTIGRTDFGYDSSSLSPITGAANHDDQSYGAAFTTRGNLTSMTRYANAAGGSGGITRTFNYDTLGNEVSGQLDCCNQKTFNYSSATQYAYTDSIVTGPAQFTTSYTWNIDNGLMLSNTDENGQTTTFQYDDLGRPAVTSFANGAQLISSYDDASVSPGGSVSTNANSAVTVRTFDGLARLIETDVKNGTALVSTTTNAYDGLGNLTQSSAPFATGATPNYTTVSYDAIGRMTNATPPSGQGVQYQYSGNSVTTTDPMGKQRKAVMDALGRLIEVDEPGETFAGAAAHGSVTINGTLQSRPIAAVQATATIAITGEPDCNDVGWVTLTVGSASTGGLSYACSFTAQQMAQALINYLNSTQVTATIIYGADQDHVQIKLTANQAGSAGNSIAFSISQGSYFPGQYPPAYGLSPGSGNLSGGQDAYTVYDAGTVSMSINGYGATATYGNGAGQDVTGSAVAADLAGRIQAQLPTSNPPFSISSSGTTISINWLSVGTAGNVTTTTTSTTTQTGYFSVPSFASCSITVNPQNCSTALSGGQDPYSSGLAHPYVTTYAYDALNNLTAISQAAGQVNGQMTAGQIRTYAHDSLGRLTGASLPESGTVTNYFTNSSGNACANDPIAVCRVQDARGIITTFTYDSMNRVTNIQYSDGTPSQTFTFDAGGAGAFALGRLTGSTDGTNSKAFTYDNMGRIASVTTTIDSVPYTVGYAYNLAGEVTAITYPSTRVVNQAYDSLGRVSGISSGSTNYLSNIAYNAADQPTSFAYGNGIQATLGYNDHLELSSVRYSGASGDILNLSYDYGTANNGQIQAVHYYTSSPTGPAVEDLTKTELFSYDPAYRLQTASTGIVNNTSGTWGVQEVYDRLGNRTQQNLTGGNPNPPPAQPRLIIDANTNRIANGGVTYDTSGNFTNDGVNAYSYDAANRLVHVNGSAASYTYFGGLRIKKVVGSTSTVYVYLGTKPIAEYVNGSLAKEYVYSGTQLLATITSASPTYHHRDHRSIRAETDTSGNVVRTYGHYPFGETWYETGTPDKWKPFTYEMDNESGLDYALSRFYSTGLGRFFSADLLDGVKTSPQTFNHYSYAVNDPVNIEDRRGLAPGIYRVCLLLDNGDNSSFCVGNSGLIDGMMTGFVGNPLQGDFFIDCNSTDCSQLGRTITQKDKNGDTTHSWSVQYSNDSGGPVWVNNLNGEELSPEGAAELGLSELVQSNLKDPKKDWDLTISRNIPTKCSPNKDRPNTLRIAVVRSDPKVKDTVSKVQGFATVQGVTGDELTMGVSLLNGGDLVPTPKGANPGATGGGPGPNVAFLQYTADAGATIVVNLTITVNSTNLLGVEKKEPISIDDIKIQIQCDKMASFQ